MKKSFTKIIAAICISALFACPAATAVEENAMPTSPVDAIQTVSLKINGQNLVSQYSPIIIGDSTVVPLRAVMESLGWKVEWVDQTQTINISNGSKKISLQIGSTVMSVNGASKHLAVAPSLIGDVTYIPIRAVSEALGATVGWDADTNTAAICTSSVSNTLTVGNYKVNVGTTVNELTAKCGEPTYKCVGDNGLLWYVYAASPASFMAVATDVGIVCGYYTSSTLFSTSDGYVYGSAMTGNAKDYKRVDGNGCTTELYYDKTDKILYGIKFMLDGYSNNYNMTIALSNQARLGLDILNSFRYAHGKSVLSWSNAAASSCTEHCLYMASIGTLTHTGSDGSSALDRYLKYNPGASWTSWGENISAGANNIFLCINGWVNSESHRNIMLSNKTHAGIGFVYSASGTYRYYAAMFLIK